MFYNQKNIIGGECHIELVDERTHEVIQDCGKIHNIVLNQGFTYLSQRSYAENTVYCAIGGGNPTTNLTDTGLDQEIARTSSLDTSLSEPAGTNINGSIYTIFRYFKFNNLDPNRFITEIGWSPDSISGSNLFSKIIIPSFRLINGAYLRVLYTFSVSIGDIYQSLYSWGEAGKCYPDFFLNFDNSTNIHVWVASWGEQLIGLKRVNSDGSIGYYDNGLDCNEPCSSGHQIFLCDIPTLATGVQVSSNGMICSGICVDRSFGFTSFSTGNYTSFQVGSGSGVYTKNAVFGTEVTGYFGSIGYGPSGSATTYNAFISTMLTGAPEGLDPFPIIYDNTLPTGMWFIKDSSHQIYISFTKTLIQ